MTLTPYQPPSLWSSLTEEEGASYSYALGKTFNLLIKLLWFFFLIALLVVSVFVWVWLAGYRSGWRFWEWAEQQPSDQPKLVLSVVYGFILVLVSPLFLFLNWAQTQLKKWLNVSFLPPIDQVDIWQLIEKQVGLKAKEKVQ